MDATIEVRDLTVRFGGVTAVDGVSFDVLSGEILGVIGPNGAGKTTMFNAVTGMVRVAGGAVRAAGRDITNARPEKVTRIGIARTFQLVRLFRSMSVAENVAVGALATGAGYRAARTEASRVIDLFGLGDVRDTPVGALPLATQKKTEIARAVATGPKVLLLDEMMNGLTREETASLVGLVRELNAGGLTVVLVEHIIPVIRALCGRLIVVDHGKLIATGTPAECLADPVVVEAYIGAAAKSPARDRDSAGGVASQESKEEA